MSKTSDADLRKLLKNNTPQAYRRRVLRVIKECRKAAQRHLRRAGIKCPKPGKGWPKLSANPTLVQRRAMEILFATKTLEHWILKNTLRAEEITFEAYKLGQLVLLAHLGPIEVDLTIGRRVRAWGIKGSIDRHGTRAERIARWQTLLSEYRALRRQPMSARSAYRILAKKYGCSEHTIRARVKVASLT